MNAAEETELGDARLSEAAAQLRKAAAEGRPTAPIREIVGTDSDIDVGYAIQEINTNHALAEGRSVSGRKIGVTSKAVQHQIGVDRPDFGTLFFDTEYGDGDEVPSSRLLQPRAEAEVALVLEHDLDHAPHGFAQLIRSVAFALPAIEIVDSRIADWDITIVDTVADNASCGLYVLGGRPTSLSSVDLRTVQMRMCVDSEEVSRGDGSACLGNPLIAARWLADTLCERGIPLRSGDVVLTGSLGQLAPLGPGRTVVADLSGLGSVAAHITG